jgi:hypothetical protein
MFDGPRAPRSISSHPPIVIFVYGDSTIDSWPSTTRLLSGEHPQNGQCIMFWWFLVRPLCAPAIRHPTWAYMRRRGILNCCRRACHLLKTYGRSLVAFEIGMQASCWTFDPFSPSLLLLATVACQTPVSMRPHLGPDHAGGWLHWRRCYLFRDVLEMRVQLILRGLSDSQMSRGPISERLQPAVPLFEQGCDGMADCIPVNIFTCRFASIPRGLQACNLVDVYSH